MKKSLALSQRFLLAPSLCTLFMVGAVLAGLGQARANDSASGPTLAISLVVDATVYNVGSPVTASIEARNLSGKPVLLDKSPAGMELRIVNDRGERVPVSTPDIYAVLPPGAKIPDSSFVLGPGSVYKFDPITIENLGARLNQPGKYGLTIVIDGRGFSASSNQVWITIDK